MTDVLSNEKSQHMLVLPLYLRTYLLVKLTFSPFSPICCKMPPIFWRIINFHPIINILNCNDHPDYWREEKNKKTPQMVQNLYVEKYYSGLFKVHLPLIHGRIP